MAVESAADLASFFNPDEFGVEATLRTNAGDVTIIGIPDSEAQTERPGENSRSSASPFLVGAADFRAQHLQFHTPFLPVAHAKAEDVLIILSGIFAGEYRIRAPIERDGDQCRILLNKR